MLFRHPKYSKSHYGVTASSVRTRNSQQLHLELERDKLHPLLSTAQSPIRRDSMTIVFHPLAGVRRHLMRLSVPRAEPRPCRSSFHRETRCIAPTTAPAAALLFAALAVATGTASAQSGQDELRRAPRGDFLPGVGAADPRQRVDLPPNHGARWGACKRRSVGAALARWSMRARYSPPRTVWWHRARASLSKRVRSISYSATISVSTQGMRELSPIRSGRASPPEWQLWDQRVRTGRC